MEMNNLYSGIKWAKSNKKYLWIRWKNEIIFIYENEREEINNILQKLNIIDSSGIAELEYLKEKLNKENVNIFFEKKGIKL